MAHQVNSTPSGVSSVQPQVARVPQNDAPLDLNLSQKVSQSLVKAHDGAKVCVSPSKSSETAAHYQPKDHTNISSNVLMLNGNGQEVHSNAKPALERSTTSLMQSQSHTDQSLQSENAETTVKAQKEHSQSGTKVAWEKGTVVSPKEKNPSIEGRSLENPKKVILALEAEDGLRRRRGRPPKDAHSSKAASKSESSMARSLEPPDPAERRLLLEERKIKLAEQRFALEEKKLEATIEIGKGLIISMERMTNTISGLGNPYRH
ncbi:hypothetical protein KP509_32G028000 [Ceratopteris richardii]|uniref:Uncharacterized protein n=1 Tax=Ceratopteris richardii TaxID=49495 RepID=A0A8T2QUA0_CERRI|nr:hypothetical protein KP509_32G028000 [Ceratopteris richardii]